MYPVSNTKLEEYQEETDFTMPDVIHKGEIVIHIKGYITTYAAKKRINVSFFGTIPERLYTGLKAEECLGQVEFDKITGEYSSEDVRITRLSRQNHKLLWGFYNQLGDYLKNKK
jgi:hypothetical protein